MSKETTEAENDNIVQSTPAPEVNVVETKFSKKVAGNSPTKVGRKQAPKQEELPKMVTLRNLLPQALTIELKHIDGGQVGRIIPTRGSLEWPDMGMHPSDFGPDVEVKVRRRYLIILR
jgi:hypothetical protein